MQRIEETVEEGAEERVTFRLVEDLQSGGINVSLCVPRNFKVCIFNVALNILIRCQTLTNSEKLAWLPLGKCSNQPPGTQSLNPAGN